MQLSRFVFLAGSVPADEDDGPLRQAILWTLISPNNRPLGRARRTFATYGECRDAVEDLRARCAAASAVASAVEATGQWVWRIDLDGEPVARSSRSYLRARECHYNLERFLEAVPTAQVVPGTRSGRRTRREEVTDRLLRATSGVRPLFLREQG